MAKPDLKIDMDKLSGVQSRIQTIFDILDNESLFKDDTAEAVGHRRLASKVRDFSDNWNDRRGDVVERLQYVKDSLGKISDQFTDLDEQLAAGLETPAPTAAPGATPTVPGGAS